MILMLTGNNVTSVTLLSFAFSKIYLWCLSTLRSERKKLTSLSRKIRNIILLVTRRILQVLDVVNNCIVTIPANKPPL